MSNIIKCAKLGVEAEGLDSPPFPGAIGLHIFENISKSAWQEWVAMQTLLINEHRLASFDPKAKQFLASEREKFLFSNDFKIPEGYIAPKN